MRGNRWIQHRLKAIQKDFLTTTFAGSGLKPTHNRLKTKARISRPRLRRIYDELPGKGILGGPLTGATLRLLTYMFWGRSIKCWKSFKEAERGDRFTSEGSLSLHPQSSKGCLLVSQHLTPVKEAPLLTQDLFSLGILRDDQLISGVLPQNFYARGVSYWNDLLILASAGGGGAGE